MMTLFKNIIYRRMLISNILSTLGDGIYYIALMTYASQFSNSGQAIFFVSLSETLPGILMIFLGSLADQTSQKVQKLLYTYLYRTILYALVGIAMGFSPALWILLLVAGLNFISDIFGKYANSLYLPFNKHIVENDQLEQASGMMSAANQMMGILAQFVGSSLILVLTMQKLAWLNSATFLVAGLIFYSVAKKLTVIEQDKMILSQKVTWSSYLIQLKTSVRILIHTKKIFALVLQVTFNNLVLFPLSALFSMFAAKYVAVQINNFAFTLAIFSTVGSIGVILGNFLGGSLLKKIPMKWIIVVSYLTLLCLCIGFITANLWLILITYGLSCSYVGILSPKFSAFLYRNVPDDILSSVIGATNSLISIGGPIAGMIVTGVAAVHFQFGILSLGILIVLSLLVLILEWRNL